MAFDGVLCVLFWMTLSQGAMSLALALPGGIPAPSAAVAPWLRRGRPHRAQRPLRAHLGARPTRPAGVVAPMEFLRLPIVALVGVWLYAEPLQIAVFVGAALILAGNLVGLRAETRRVGR